MWSKFLLYWTGMNGSGNTGRTRDRRAYSNLDTGQQFGAALTRIRTVSAVRGARRRRRPSAPPRSVSRHGFKNTEDRPMIQEVNEAIERAHRLTGTPRDQIVRGFVRGNIP